MRLAIQADYVHFSPAQGTWWSWLREGQRLGNGECRASTWKVLCRASINTPLAVGTRQLHFLNNHSTLHLPVPSKAIMKFAIVASVLAMGASAVEMKACSGTNMGGRCTTKVSHPSSRKALVKMLTRK